jgi:hypothetical protein
MSGLDSRRLRSDGNHHMLSPDREKLDVRNQRQVSEFFQEFCGFRAVRSAGDAS